MFIAQACHANFVFAHALDSLICVSRQDEWHHTVTMHYFHVHMQRHSPTRQQFTKPLLFHWCTDLTRIHRARHSVRTPTQDSQPNLHRLVQASTPAHSNLPQKGRRLPSFPLQQLRALLSLCPKSCFTFPSWYLFTIGPRSIFIFA